ncbi:MAG TPA: SET domain-containing protein-lysine N-methyltransferase [Steroidobacteraceae bacterium]|nr:SET domain-containing protein-lysine N-methyltransferase [Steroidobacteraceae bacterium]
MKNPPARRRAPLFEVRHSPIHGHGVFAVRRIRKGTAVIEYLGNRVTHAQADERYRDKSPDDNHTFLFTVDARTVIDAGIDGNEARFINHACEPNCESTIENRRVFIRAIRTIQPGEELSYDYQIQRDSDDAPNVDEVYACRCGAKQCRGSMLVAPPRKRRKPAHRAPGRAATQPRAARKQGATRHQDASRNRTARRGGLSERRQRRGR